MSGKIIAKVLLVLLLAAITLAFPSIVQPVKAINIDTAITINADGTISPSNMPITRNGDTYTLTSDVELAKEGIAILIQKSNIILDGAGHILNGTIPPDYGYIDIGNWGIKNAESNVTIKNFIITNFTNTGISISRTPNCTIRNNTIYYCNPPVGVWETTNCTIIGNYIKPRTNALYGIWLGENANNNTIIENTCVGQGVGTYHNYGNQIYHNNFLRIDESTPLQFYCVAAQNIWDNGYPSGGNFWDGYNGVDGNGDGLGDTPYIIDSNNQDNYPLMNPYSLNTKLEMIVDNTNAIFVGSWPTSTYYPGYYGNNYQWNTAGSGVDTCTWNFNIPSAGSYQVFARWTSAANRATNARYRINYAGGFSTTIQVNQQLNGGSWQSLGTFNFNVGNYSVSLSDLANGEVNADAILIIPATIPTEIIVDNTAASFVGSWPTSTYYPGYYGANYQWNTAGTGADKCTWSFNIPISGSYQVFARWTNASNRAKYAPYTIHSVSGDSLVTVNQLINGGTWQSLGTYMFNAESYSVSLSDFANGDGEVNADAIRIIPVPIPTEIIVDNTAGVFFGPWPTSTYYPGYYGSNYQWNTAGYGADTCTWSFNIITAGQWQVFARWTSAANRATNAKYTINYAGGSTIVTINQQINGGSWQLLGTYSLNVGTSSIILSDNANGEVNADAIRLVKTS